MKVDIYAICWNEEDLIEFFFRHYDSIASRYIIFDDGSTDRTIELLSANPKVEVRPFERSSKDSYILSAQAIHNNAWKESRGAADWVLITAIDEHLKHPDLSGYLRKCKNSGVTLLPAVGYQMVSDDFPKASETLAAAVPYGAPFENMSKLTLFQPAEIEETNYDPGRHNADPIGNVIIPQTDEALNLHFKYLGFERLCARHKMLASGLGELDVQRGWGHRYWFDHQQLREDFDRFKQDAVNLHDLGATALQAHSAPRWWRNSAKSFPTVDVK